MLSINFVLIIRIIVITIIVVIVWFNFYCSRWNIVYLILVLHGIGILMPWNMFINAKSVSKYLNFFNQNIHLYIIFNFIICNNLFITKYYTLIYFLNVNVYN